MKTCLNGETLMKPAGRVLLVLTSLAAFGLAQSGIVRYTGKVREFVWQNPNVYVRFDVKGSGGTLEMYRLVCGAPSDALRMGLRRDSVKQGNILVVEVNQNRTSRNFGETTAILPDGRKVRDCVLE